MKLSQFKKSLQGLPAINFVLPDGTFVPRHYHITEVGLVTRHYIDCGGTVRLDQVANFQLWVANDQDHRLTSEKLLGIIGMSEKLLGSDDLDIEVEYQTGTIGKYGLEAAGDNFALTVKETNCLAQDACGIPVKDQLLATEITKSACCTAGGGCC